MQTMSKDDKKTLPLINLLGTLIIQILPETMNTIMRESFTLINLSGTTDDRKEDKEGIYSEEPVRYFRELDHTANNEEDSDSDNPFKFF